MTTKFGAAAYHGTLVSLYLVCLAGLAVSIWAHVVSFMGIDPRQKYPGIWIVEVALTLILLPLVTAVFRRGIHEDPLRLSRRNWKLIIALTAYYAFHFYLFIARASEEELTSDMTWHMFSAGWILLFTVAFAFYRSLVRSVAGQRTERPTERRQPAI